MNSICGFMSGVSNVDTPAHRGAGNVLGVTFLFARKVDVVFCNKSNGCKRPFEEGKKNLQLTTGFCDHTKNVCRRGRQTTLEIMMLARGVVVALIVGIVSVSANLDTVERPIQIVQLVPTDDAQVLSLVHLYETGILDFWRAPTKVGATVDVMVDQRQKAQLEAFALENGISTVKTLVTDLEQMITDQESDANWRAKAIKMLHGSGRSRDALEAGMDDFGLSMADYHPYGDIVAWMGRIAARMPTQARVFSIGRTVEGREINGLKIGNPVGDSSKRIIWIDGGIHAREWTAVHTTVYFIYKIINKLQRREADLLKVLDSVELVVIPVLNPDGYEFTRTEPRNALVRMWRKSRSNDRCATDRNGKQTCCKGVDLNRNFDYRWAETGTSFHPCSEIYHGAGAFSEPETRNVRDAILNSDLTGRIDAYVTLHAYSQLWIYPYSNKKQSYPADIADLKKVAARAVNAIGKLFGTRYMHGTGPEIIYAYTGGSSDWAKEKAGIKYSYTIELRPSYYSWNGFVLDKSQLIPTARETYDGIWVVLDTVAREARGEVDPVPVVAPTPARPTTTPRPLAPGECRDVESTDPHFA
uniref:Peptidase_M14 domain-containing protein n=1 Tax=Panagrellus redivivus TaxID=6233 RepID=A0A7E4VYX8_PANRE